MSLNTSDIQRYFQFCENYQYMCNNMLDNQIFMFNNLYNLINNNPRFGRTPQTVFRNNTRVNERNNIRVNDRNNDGFRRRPFTRFRNPFTPFTTLPNI